MSEGDGRVAQFLELTLVPIAASVAVVLVAPRVAVPPVFAFHFTLVPRVLSGFLGVDVFFVLSGFLITRIIREGLRSGTFRLKTFWIQRIRRLAPALGVGLAATGSVAIGAIALVRNPPAVDPNGGWSAMQAAGQRIVSDVNGGSIAVFGLPNFKLPDAVSFPVAHAGGNVVQLTDPTGFPADTAAIVVACDRLFEGAIGAPCGGPAEDVLVAGLTVIGSGPSLVRPRLVDRFDASPRTSISVYAP